MNHDLDIACEIASVAGVVLWSGTSAGAELFNQRWLDYAGGTGETWRARGWEAAVHDEDRARCTVAWTEALRRRAIGDVEVRLRNSAGEYRWHRVRFVLGGDGRWYGIAFDLGERSRTDVAGSDLARERAARGDAEQISRIQDRFLAAVSHELRAPTAALLLWERLLREQELDPAEKQRALDAIHQCALSQARLVDDLLDVARVSAGKLAVRLVPLELAAILERALEEMRPAIAAKQQVLDATIDADLGRVEGDEVRLLQIVVNLLDNAIKFTPSGGRISLAARRADAGVVVEVSDDGRGIEPRFLPHVFEMFSQLDDKTARAGAGLGLGLAIAKELVELHGGTLEAASAGLGAGARFTLRLPSTQRAPAPPPSRDTHALDGLSVLVVDDDDRVLVALEILLARAGATVIRASSAAGAWAALERAAPDVIVSDVAMPITDGYALIRRIREEPAFARVPAIALTAHAALADAERSRAAGFDVHLPKPVDLDVLVASIARLAGARSRG